MEKHPGLNSDLMSQGYKHMCDSIKPAIIHSEFIWVADWLREECSSSRTDPLWSWLWSGRARELRRCGDGDMLYAGPGARV